MDRLFKLFDSGKYELIKKNSTFIIHQDKFSYHLCTDFKFTFLITMHNKKTLLSKSLYIEFNDIDLCFTNINSTFHCHRNLAAIMRRYQKIKQMYYILFGV